MGKYILYIENLLFFLSLNFISVTHWEQINNFTSTDHQNIQTNIEICAKDGKFYTQWGLSFDKQQEIELKNVQINDENALFSFENNQLILDIGKFSNQQKMNIKINYDLKYDNSCRDIDFCKKAIIAIPDYVKNAKAKLIVKIPSNFIIYTNLNFLKKKSNGLFVWSGIPKRRVCEDIGICLKKASWNLNTIISTFFESSLDDLKLSTDLLYRGANNHLKNFSVFCNGKRVKYKIQNNHILVNSRNLNTCFQKYEFKSQVENFCDNYEFDKSLTSNEDFFGDEAIDFKAIVKDILASDKSKCPAYVKVCRWVNMFLLYDLETAGKKMGAESIYIKRKGVCEHYAVLFKRLMHELKIPCYVVSGVAYSFENKNFIPHAWNIIFWKDKWIPLDPTWNITSGVVPISHIFTKIDLENGSGIEAKVEFKDRKKENKVTMNIVQKAEFNPTPLR